MMDWNELEIRYEIERIITRRLFNNEIDGHTLPMAQEIYRRLIELNVLWPEKLFETKTL
jgi:hypothetical protein